MSLNLQSLDISALLNGYRGQQFTPVAIITALLERIRAAPERHVWISRFDDATVLAAAAELQRRDPASLPLYGIPFVIKDNIDLAGLPTTAACPAFAYAPTTSAVVVARLLAAGAIALGKTNLDQFATGLVGTRSPYGACCNSFEAEYISGGSSSGSAVAVATGLASFALGTDTAGSGRVPAAFNNLVGYKPTLGFFSARGMLPACRSLDTISVFAFTAGDAARVGAVAGGFDATDAYSRPAGDCPGAARLLQNARWGVPRREQREFYGDVDYARAFEAVLQTLATRGVELVEVDIGPLVETARLLYEGPWVAERLLAVEALLHTDPAAILPITRGIIERATNFSAADTFRAQYRLAELRRQAEGLWAQMDGLITPTACSHYRIAAVEAEPVRLNTQLGHYTNYVNLLNLAAVALPAGFAPNSLPFGITLVGPAWSDAALLGVAARWQPWLNWTAGATGLQLMDTSMPAVDLPGTGPVMIDVAVCGAHLAGLPLNPQLTERGATLRHRTRTASCYRFYALPGGPPRRPGLVRVGAGGGAIEVEVWSVPAAQFGSFVAGIPAPLGIGRIQLADGTTVAGFLCEQYAVDDAEDITNSGGWRNWLRSQVGPKARRQMDP
jgi:allophanate hydrolase